MYYGLNADKLDLSLVEIRVIYLERDVNHVITTDFSLRYDSLLRRVELL